MRLQQLLFINALINSGLHITQAAKLLHTSQPGVSRYVRLLEEELGVQIFVRQRKRLVGLTPIGKEVVAYTKRALSEIDQLRKVTEDYRSGGTGSLTVATAHVHARYTLPDIVRRFTQRYPKTRMRLHQGYGAQLVNWVVQGDADLFIGTGPDEPHPEIVIVPCHVMYRTVLTPKGHPLLKLRRVQLEDIARYPIITYGEGISALTSIKRSFAARQIIPNIVLSATDTDVMKVYVRSGLGIAILAEQAFDPREDRDIRSANARHLFDTSAVDIGLRRNTHLTPQILDFVRLFAPHLKAEQLERAVRFA